MVLGDHYPFMLQVHLKVKNQLERQTDVTFTSVSMQGTGGLMLRYSVTSEAGHEVVPRELDTVMW